MTLYLDTSALVKLYDERLLAAASSEGLTAQQVPA